MAGKIEEVSTRMWKRSLLYCISISKSSEKFEVDKLGMC